jgi:hypothetical protein
MPTELTEKIENAMDDLKKETVFFLLCLINLIMGQNTNDIQDRY